MKLLRYALLATVLAAPVMIAAPASATGPATPFEEVATARDGQQARAQRRHRRHAAAQRRHREAARARRARAAQG